MRVLLDHQMPHQLRHALRSHEVATAAYMGWDRTGNGALLAAARDAGFDALVTADKGFRDDPERQRQIADLTRLRVVFVGGLVNRITALAAADELDRAILDAVPGKLREVYITERARGRARVPDLPPPDPWTPDR